MRRRIVFSLTGKNHGRSLSGGSSGFLYTGVFLLEAAGAKGSYERDTYERNLRFPRTSSLPGKRRSQDRSGSHSRACCRILRSQDPGQMKPRRHPAQPGGPASRQFRFPRRLLLSLSRRASSARDRRNVSIGILCPRSRPGTPSWSVPWKMVSSRLGRDDIDMVGLNCHLVICFDNRDACDPLQDLREHARVAGVEMGDEDKRHAAVCGDFLKKGSKASSPPADAPIPMMGKPVFTSGFFISPGVSPKDLLFLV